MFTSITSQEDLKKSLTVQTPSITTEDGMKTSFQLSHHLVDNQLIENYVDSDSCSEEDRGIKLNSSNNSSNSSSSGKEIKSAIEVRFDLTRHETKNKKQCVFLMDIDIKTQSILLEATPSSLIHISSLMNPFEYFYHSSLDSELPIFKQFIHESYKLPPPAPVSKQISKPDQKPLIIGDVRISHLPYISLLIYLFKNESEYLQTLYQAHIGDYVSQNHFINENEHIKELKAVEHHSSYAFDMLLKYLQLTSNLKVTNDQAMLSNYAVFLEVTDISWYFEPNIHDIQVELKHTMLSLVDGIHKEPISKFQEVIINNVPNFENDTEQHEPEEEVKSGGATPSKGPKSSFITPVPQKQYFKSNQCFVINEEDSEEYEDNITNKIEELNVIFEKKKSTGLSLDKSSNRKHKKNYLHIDFSGGVYFGLTHTNLLTVNEITESIMDHVMGIKSIFYTANTWLRDITGYRQNKVNQKEFKRADSPMVDIDDIVEGIESPEKQAEEQLSTLHRSLFKLELTCTKIQFDLLDESGQNVEAQVFSIYEPKPINPFDSTASLGERSSVGTEHLHHQETSCSKLALLTLLIENTGFQLNMLEEVNGPDETRKLKIDLKFDDLILVNELFIISPELDSKLSPVSESIPLHPKLFDQGEVHHGANFLNYPITIDNILLKHPERVMVYCQRGLKEKYLSDNLHCTKVELFIVLKTKEGPVAEEFDSSD